MVLLGDQAQVEYLVSVRLEIVLILGDGGHVEPCCDPFEDSVSVGARKVHGLL